MLLKDLELLSESCYTEFRNEYGNISRMLNGLYLNIK